jgi:FdhE protein
LTPLTPGGWLEAHPYLRPVAELCAVVERAAAGLVGESAAVPAWDDYESDFRAGVPLLQSANMGIDLEPAGRMAVSLADRLAADSSSERLRAEASALAAELRLEADSPRRVVGALLGDETAAPGSRGLLRYLGWTAARRFLEPVLESFGRWRNEEAWSRRYCSTCGSAPAMAQLMGTDPGRLRLLACGCCGTRWRYRRTQCPFCENDSQRLAVVGVEGEGGLRIDYCESCLGYLKTYDGQGHEDLLLLDWTSLHLDFVAHDRGLKRLAASLYSLGETSVESGEPSVARTDA